MLFMSGYEVHIDVLPGRSNLYEKVKRQLFGCLGCLGTNFMGSYALYHVSKMNLSSGSSFLFAYALR